MPHATGECDLCGGTGFRVRSDGNYLQAMACDCRRAAAGYRRLQAARLPRRYLHCDLDNYDTLGEESLLRARQIAVEFVDKYPAVPSGLLFIGGCGVGKTHLAVGILRALLDKMTGFRGQFVDFRELLKEIQDTYNPATATSASEVLRPILDADILVLDDLGAAKMTDWVRDTLAQIITRRYNQELVTVFTTNFPDPDSAESEAGATEPRLSVGGVRAAPESLSDRIGAALRSRLHEMCKTVEILGDDYRKKARRADHRWW